MSSQAVREVRLVFLLASASRQRNWHNLSIFFPGRERPNSVINFSTTAGSFFIFSPYPTKLKGKPNRRVKPRGCARPVQGGGEKRRSISHGRPKKSLDLGINKPPKKFFLLPLF